MMIITSILLASVLVLAAAVAIVAMITPIHNALAYSDPDERPGWDPNGANEDAPDQ